MSRRGSAKAPSSLTAIRFIDVAPGFAASITVIVSSKHATPNSAASPAASIAASTADFTDSSVRSEAVKSMSATYAGAVPTGDSGSNTMCSTATSTSRSARAISGRCFRFGFRR